MFVFRSVILIVALSVLSPAHAKININPVDSKIRNLGRDPELSRNLQELMNAPYSQVSSALDQGSPWITQMNTDHQKMVAIGLTPSFGDILKINFEKSSTESLISLSPGEVAGCLFIFSHVVAPIVTIAVESFSREEGDREIKKDDLSDLQPQSSPGCVTRIDDLHRLIFDNGSLRLAESLSTNSRTTAN